MESKTDSQVRMKSWTAPGPDMIHDPPIKPKWKRHRRKSQKGWDSLDPPQFWKNRDCPSNKSFVKWEARVQLTE